MQFAGQRTGMDLQTIGEPVNITIRLAEDVVPDPDAIMVTGITPQSTLGGGITEAEFLKIFHEEVSIPNTVFIGFNNVRFDDEFMRYLHYRNFYDAYEWQWQDGRSRWDLLDLIRMTRALRPEGIIWPVDDNGVATNRLEALTGANDILHETAHDALSDVKASIAVAQLIRAKQPKMFDYLLGICGKKAVKGLVEKGQPFLYTSGQYSAEWDKTTVVSFLAAHPKKSGSLVYDLRYDPAPYNDMTAVQLADTWRYQKDSDKARLPVKLLQYNRCPALAPLGVLDDDSQKRLSISLETIQDNLKKLSGSGLSKNILAAVKILDDERQAVYDNEESDVDAQLYNGFFEYGDKSKMNLVRTSSAIDMTDLQVDFSDQRLVELLPRYKARNFPQSLTDNERFVWEKYRYDKLLGGQANSRLANYFNRLAELAKQPGLTTGKRFLLEELQLYGQTIMPIGDDI